MVVFFLTQVPSVRSGQILQVNRETLHRKNEPELV
jgi:hypothetical protein